MRPPEQETPSAEVFVIQRHHGSPPRSMGVWLWPGMECDERCHEIVRSVRRYITTFRLPLPSSHEQ
jgi:hypothetical protein